MQVNKTRQKRRSASTKAKEPPPFDPTAYAALIAIAAAEKRLRESHSRTASSSSARPSSVQRAPYEPSQDVHVTEVVRSPPPPRFSKQTSAATVASSSFFHTTYDSRRVEEIVARYRPQTQPTATESTRATGSVRTLLEQLALASESNSSAASDGSDVGNGDKGVTAVELSAERAELALSPRQRPHSRSLSPLVVTPLRKVSHSSRLSSSSSPSSSSAADPADKRVVLKADLHAAKLIKDGNGGEGGEGDDSNTTMSLRDASPLREQIVIDTAGMSYRVSTVESVHAVAEQLNFALYQ